MVQKYIKSVLSVSSINNSSVDSLSVEQPLLETEQSFIPNNECEQVHAIERSVLHLPQIIPQKFNTHDLTSFNEIQPFRTPEKIRFSNHQNSRQIQTNSDKINLEELVTSMEELLIGSTRNIEISDEVIIAPYPPLRICIILLVCSMLAVFWSMLQA